MTTPKATDPRERRLRQLCAELERRLRAGDDVSAADLLRSHPHFENDADAAVELIYAEFVTREHLGQKPNPADFCRRYPRWAGELREQLRIHELMSQCLDASVGQTATWPVETGEKPLQQDGISGREFAHYVIEHELGRGANAVVYLARDRNLDRHVAIKVLLSGPHASKVQIERLRQEAHLVADLQHPNFVQVYEIGTHDGWFFAALEYVTGTTLQEKLSHGPLPPSSAAQLVATIARAMHVAHQHGIIHRDIKPANILLTQDGSPKIADLGLAKQVFDDAEQTGSNTIVGTPSFMAPEQAGKTRYLGPATDVYSMGAVLYYALTGRAPFEGSNAIETIQQLVHEEPLPPRRLRPGIPRDLEIICLKCLRKEPYQRYATALALAEDLERFLQNRPIEARPVSDVERLWLWAKRRPLVAGLTLLLLAAAICIFAGGWWYNDHLKRALNQAKEQLERTQRGQYALQLLQAQSLCERDPVRSLQLLEDEERCPQPLRDFTWHVLHRLADRCLLSLKGEGRMAVAFAPRSPVLAIADEGGTVQLWDAANGRKLAILQETGPAVCQLAFDPGGITLVAGCADGTICCWHLEDKTQRTWKAHHGRVNRLAFTPSGVLVSGGADGLIQVWLPDSEQPIVVLKGHRGPITALAVGKDGDTVASASGKEETWLWSLRTQAHRPLGRITFEALCLALAPDNKTLAVAGDNEMVVLIDTVSGRQKGRLFAHYSPVLALAFSADGGLLVAGSKDHSAKIWNPQTRRLLTTLKGHRLPVRSIALSSDSSLLATGSEDGTVRVWRALPPLPYHEFQGHGESLIALAFSPDSRYFASSSFDRSLCIWELESQKRLHAFAHFAEVGKRRIPVHRIRGIVFADDGKSLITANEYGYLQSWDVVTGKPQVTIQRPKKFKEYGYFALAKAPGGRWLAAGRDDGILELWDLSSLKLVHSCHAHRQPIASVAFSHDGHFLATGSLDRTAKVWRLPDLQPHVTLSGHHDWVQSVAFSPDSRTLATGSSDETIRLWEVNDGTLKAILSGHAQAVGCVVFTPDGKTLISATGDRWRSVPGEIKFWDAQTGDLRANFGREAGPITINESGTLLASGSEDGRIRIWQTQPLSAARQR
ncbi:MAG: hypothetical protein KatS3mg105_2112 [Gemmatales bacterium]|nr:MAG: hypothetical protein KatS3mg105_2112 [Gemmatales bacterium]